MSINGSKVLSGTWGEVWIDGVKCFVLSAVKMDIEVQREDIQDGIDIDSKLTGMKGTGNIKIKKVYTKSKPILEAMKKGKDKRVNIVAKLKDPDAVNAQTERWGFDGVWFNTIPAINWEKPTPVEEEYAVGFPPTKADPLDEIKES